MLTMTPLPSVTLPSRFITLALALSYGTPPTTLASLPSKFSSSKIGSPRYPTLSMTIPVPRSNSSPVGLAKTDVVAGLSDTGAAGGSGEGP